MTKALEAEIARDRKALAELQNRKGKSKPQKVKVIRPKGRPRINESVIEKARSLAEKFPLPDVALKTGIALRTIYRYDIKRKILNAAKLKAECDLTA